jgi:uncharacterized protein YjbJ (UPF0337 family)
MNVDQLEGKWHVLKGRLLEKWGKLTDNDLAIMSGHSELLVGKIQELYGLDKEAARKEFEIWLAEQDDASAGR